MLLSVAAIDDVGAIVLPEDQVRLVISECRPRFRLAAIRTDEASEALIPHRDHACASAAAKNASFAPVALFMRHVGLQPLS